MKKSLLTLSSLTILTLANNTTLNLINNTSNNNIITNLQSVQVPNSLFLEL